MFTELIKIVQFILQSIFHVWPYLLITVPVAVIVNLSGASKHISKAFSKKPLVSIFLATVIGAFSPFCSCSVIPIIASLLIGGVPLAPVMSFWLASPSMDPEVFFLSVSFLGWNLAVWRFFSAFAMSLSAGYITHILIQKGWITNEDTLKSHSYMGGKKNSAPTLRLFTKMKESFMIIINILTRIYSKPEIAADCCTTNISIIETGIKDNKNRLGCCNDNEVNYKPELPANFRVNCCCPAIQGEMNINYNKTELPDKNKTTFYSRLFKEIISASFMVIKFMVLAYFLEALIVLYIPSNIIHSLLGTNKIFSIIMAAIMGVPIYTNTLAALAMVGGLVTQGMTPAAGLAFLISGPTTTIPAMAAVWKLANKKVFLLYVGFTFAGALLCGILFHLFTF